MLSLVLGRVIFIIVLITRRKHLRQGAEAEDFGAEDRQCLWTELNFLIVTLGLIEPWFLPWQMCAGKITYVLLGYLMDIPSTRGATFISSSVRKSSTVQYLQTQEFIWARPVSLWYRVHSALLPFNNNRSLEADFCNFLKLFWKLWLARGLRSQPSSHSSLFGLTSHHAQQRKCFLQNNCPPGYLQTLSMPQSLACWRMQHSQYESDGRRQTMLLPESVPRFVARPQNNCTLT